MATETLSELGQHIRRLTNLAYPTAPSDLRETLAKEQFIDALISSDMRLRIKQARPHDLNDAVRHAVELEAFNKAERKQMEGQGYMRSTSDMGHEKPTKMENDMKALQKTVSELHKSFEAWKQPKSTGSNNTRNTGDWKLQKRRCYICDSDKHLKFKCPQNPRNQKEKPGNGEPEKQHQAKHVASTSSGLYAECKINNTVMDCLIDTGATLSILSLKTWDVIQQSCSEGLKRFEPQIYTASGNQVDVKGMTRVMVEIVGIKCITEVIVADIDMDAILGLDFLKANDCQLDISTNTLKIKGQDCELNLTGKIGCYRVTVSETIELPARSEMIIEGKVHVPALRKNEIGIVEPTGKLIN